MGSWFLKISTQAKGADRRVRLRFLPGSSPLAQSAREPRLRLRPLHGSRWDLASPGSTPASRLAFLGARCPYRVIAKRENDDSNPEQTAPLEVNLISSCLPHRCSAHHGMPGRPPAVRGRMARLGRDHGKSSSLLSPKGEESVGLKLGKSPHPLWPGGLVIILQGRPPPPPFSGFPELKIMVLE